MKISENLLSTFSACILLFSLFEFGRAPSGVCTVVLFCSVLFCEIVSDNLLPCRCRRLNIAMRSYYSIQEGAILLLVRLLTVGARFENRGQKNSIGVCSNLDTASVILLPNLAFARCSNVLTPSSEYFSIRE